MKEIHLLIHCCVVGGSSCSCYVFAINQEKAGKISCRKYQKFSMLRCQIDPSITEAVLTSKFPWERERSAGMVQVRLECLTHQVTMTFHLQLDLFIARFTRSLDLGDLGLAGASPSLQEGRQEEWTDGKKGNTCREPLGSRLEVHFGCVNKNFNLNTEQQMFKSTLGEIPQQKDPELNCAHPDRFLTLQSERGRVS